ncbi:hypothetical protein [Brachybacterium atlanticum]|uniref:hypothetical protein n=1 Tax=Brachybacterium atlanticum TaxID=2911888 RepID=UPI0021E0E375|nr:hypothetical protein [Brachybacterium atlanticum]
MTEPFRLSSDIFKYWQIDYETNSMKIVFQDGRALKDGLTPPESTANHYISSSVFDWEHWWIFSTTTRGHTIITEGYNPHSPPPLNGRPSVYLDQNHWRTLADAIHHPTGIDDPLELIAAVELIHLAADGGIVLPLSMGHMIETSGLHGDRRYEVGVTMASLSKGWQIRNPLDLWKWEATATMYRHLKRPTPVMPPAISTEPGSLYESGADLGINDRTSENEIFMAMLTMPSVTLNSLIEPDSMPKDELNSWVDRHSRITRQINALDVPKNERRNIARRRYWNENIAFYVRPYRALTNSLDSPIFSDRELPKLLAPSPMVGLVSELFVRRFMDKQVKWRRNDLIDMFHLSGAAAYADYVCAESHTGTQLRTTQKALGRTQTVYTSLHDLVRAVRANGVKSISERIGDSDSAGVELE